MSWQQFYRDSLSEKLDENGDLTPPWERFPNYERYTIGWRMGEGEDWLSYWHVFLEDLDAAFEVRLAYLKRHPPAPVNWADRVYGVLHPSAKDEEEDGDDATDQLAVQRRAELLHLGLIASDAAYPIWRSQQQGVRWPWESDEPPETVARYWTRDLWFWSRQVAELRGSAAWVSPQVPENWQPCAGSIETGRVPTLDPRQGLLSLAQMLSAGRVVAPWQLGLGPDDFTDSFEMDMGFVDAFRLFVMSAFDDREHLQRYLSAAGMPASWDEWVGERNHLD